GAKNKEWLQIQADVFGVTIVTRTEEQGPAYGAAMLAAMGEKWFKSFKDLNDAWIEYKEKIVPITEHINSYQTLFNIYKNVYTAT
ncbi:FGGY-family carbohydrate kinase, partial [Escherichia coli]